jgi:glycerol-3-phosphate dehydrogenase subunit B
MNDTRREFDLIVVGAGLAGMAATAFAVERGLKALQIGATPGEMHFASGLLDLLGIHSLKRRNRLDNPWAGISALIQDSPKHPYARVGLENIRHSLEVFVKILDKAGLRYDGWPEENAVLATCAGTAKITYKVPASMWPGVIGWKEKSPALIIDFEGMKDFSALQMVRTIGSQWPGLRAQRLEFPCPLKGLDCQNIFMAEALGSPQVRSDLAATIKPLLEDAKLVGMPAILGVRKSGDIAADLERQIGAPVFEIPTMPPSVPGLRLKEAMERELLRKGAALLHGSRALAINSSGSKCVSVVIGARQSQEILKAKGVVIATGRFLGGGLAASRSEIRETLLDLPVYQPEKRQDWHLPSFLDPEGHPVNQAGLEVDDLLRPLGPHGRCAYKNLFAAGSLLAHQDWKRMKCGAGLAIATAYGAVLSFIDLNS